MAGDLKAGDLKAGDPMIERADEIATVEGYRRRQAWLRTMDENRALSEVLQREAAAALEGSPAAMEAFIRRNHHKRRLSNVQRLEAELRSRNAIP